ncbi:hypothetical protein H696_05799 [Fonticula alba]|uniref:Uncharacterized protein n=1 Tax=Fonticula alba TaxID=691883 RepID=A0A058Z092_FONAL|nr:hypothetical protein H696_05799 [Fonticula alba]KCV67689.1 hypothetical protein H696_05799 [Fonticula alba]|eukprot:XP_009497873.1 hypothetical protein H696_05799 [Fonticula alba]
MFRQAVTSLFRSPVVRRGEGDVIRGSQSFKQKQKAVEDQWIRQKEAEALERLAQRLPNKAKQTKNGLPNTGKKINERK